MWKPEQSSKAVGEYLAGLIDGKYPSRRAFCRDYLRACGEEPTADAQSNMSNRLSQIIKGRKSIQIYDLPHFCNLLGVSCEELLSAGKCHIPSASRVTNYSIACSSDPAEWEAYLQREDKLILNCDEYCKSVIDYAFEFRNYGFLKYLMEHKYIWFVGDTPDHYFMTFGAGTSIERRDIGHTDIALYMEPARQEALRIQLISLAAAHGDLPILEELRARENPTLYDISRFLRLTDVDRECQARSRFPEDILRHIASSGEEVLDYFTDPFTLRPYRPDQESERYIHTFLFPDISRLLDLLVVSGSPFAETALKKALKHSKATYRQLCDLASKIKQDEYCVNSCDPDIWLKISRERLEFHADGGYILFQAHLTSLYTRKIYTGIATNIARVSAAAPAPVLRHLCDELNESYNTIRDLRDNLEEVIR